MKTRIDVKDRNEAEAIRRALAHPETRALVVVMGTLLALETTNEQRRCLAFVADKLADEVPRFTPARHQLRELARQIAEGGR